MPPSSEETRLKTTTTYAPCDIEMSMSVEAADASLRRRRDCSDDESDQKSLAGLVHGKVSHGE